MVAHNCKTRTVFVKDALMNSRSLFWCSLSPCLQSQVWWKRSQIVEMAGKQCLPCECQCHGRCIVEVARDVMGDVDRSSVYMDTRMSNDRKHEWPRSLHARRSTHHPWQNMSCWARIPVSPTRNWLWEPWISMALQNSLLSRLDMAIEFFRDESYKWLWCDRDSFVHIRTFYRCSFYGINGC